MKNYFISLFLLLIGVSCQFERYTDVTTTSLEFSSLGGDITLPITSNERWSLVIDNNWIYATPTEGEGNTNVIISADHNPTTSDRNTIIELISNSGISHTINVIQKQNDSIATNVNQMSFDWSGGQKKLNYKCNIETSVYTEDKWITIKESRAMNDRSIYIVVDKNTNIKKRNGSIIIEGKDKKNIITVVQEPFVELSVVKFAEGVSNFIYGNKNEIQLTPLFYPENASDKSLEWESSDETIATVSNNGMVSTKQFGKVKITATNKYSNLKAEIELEIVPKKAEHIHFDSKYYEVEGTFGYSFSPVFTPVPEDGYLGNLIISSSDPQIVRVEGNNIICNNDNIKGKAQIKVYSEYSDITTYFNVTVAEAYSSVGIGIIKAYSNKCSLTIAGILHSDNPNDIYMFSGAYIVDENGFVNILDITDGLYEEGNRVRWESNWLYFDEGYNSLLNRSKRWTVYVSYRYKGKYNNVISAIDLGHSY